MPDTTGLDSLNVLATSRAADFVASGAGMNKMVHALTGSVARSDTTAKVLGVLPVHAFITAIRIQAAAASNAVTTATLSLGKSGGTGTEFLNAHDVKTAGTGAGQVSPNGAVLGDVGASAVTVTAVYAESGGASSAGGPWQIVIEFVTATT